MEWTVGRIKQGRRERRETLICLHLEIFLKNNSLCTLAPSQFHVKCKSSEIFVNHEILTHLSPCRTRRWRVWWFSLITIPALEFQNFITWPSFLTRQRIWLKKVIPAASRDIKSDNSILSLQLCTVLRIIGLTSLKILAVSARD